MFAEYSRLVLVRYEYGEHPNTLVQRVNGRLIFPGGMIEKGEDPIDALVRECGEEGRFSRENIRQIRNWELLWGSQRAEVRWSSRGRCRLDHVFIVPWYRDIYEGLETIGDSEIRSVHTMTLFELAGNKSAIPIPHNTRMTARVGLQLLPSLLQLPLGLVLPC